MCGIAGIVDLDGAPIDRSLLDKMGESLRHRGPDAQGVFVDDRGAPSVGFVHRRLSIIDLSRRADQPIAGEDGSVCVMLNGEIYNFAQLRSELEKRHTFRSRGDTETIVHGYEEQGDDVVHRLDGMFAFALWDAGRRRVLLARDVFGKKPLYYAVAGRRLLFASEIKGILAAGFAAEPAVENLPEYLAFGYVPTPRTFFRGVCKLPPSCTLAVDRNGVGDPRPYWDLRFPPEGEAKPVSEGEAVEETSRLLVAAVKKRLVSDVPLGVLLSGGVDSSGVASIAAELAGGHVRTFCVGFEGDNLFDERPYAEAVARHIGSEHHSEVVHPDASALLETLIHHHDEPFGDSSALPTYLVAQAARRHVTVVLNGDGGDEAFAGYDRFQAALLAERTPQIAVGLGRLLFGAVPRGLGARHPLRRAQRFADKAARPFVERVFAWSTFSDRDDLRELGGDGLADPHVLLGSYRQTLRTLDASTPKASVLSRLLYLNARTYLLDDLLPKMDRMTMAHGLEARSPFLDRALFEYAALLPDAYKRRGRRGKIVLKKALAPRIPDTILRRPKQGFGVPLGRWFRTDLKELVADTLLGSPRFGAVIPPAPVRRLVALHQSGERDAGHQLWVLVTLELWLRRHSFSF